MKKYKKIFFSLIYFLFPFFDCSSPEKVSKAILSYLEDKYHHKFKRKEVSMSYDEGNWGTSKLIVYSITKDIDFNVVYDFSRESVTWESCKIELWKRDLLNKLNLYGKNLFQVFKINLYSYEKEGMQSMELPFFEDYKTLLKQVPNLGFTIEIVVDEKNSNFNSRTKENNKWIELLLKISSVLKNFLQEGFVVVNIKLFKNPKAKEPIFQWKLPKENSTPNQTDIQKLISIYNSRDTVSEMFQQANLKEKSGEIEDSIKIYKKIIEKFDSPFKYDAYILNESIYTYESLVKIIDYYKKNGSKKTSDGIC
jgi:uncharacterized protein YkuJ